MNRSILPIVACLTLAACAKTEEASLVPPQEEDGYNMVEPVAAPLVGDGLALGEWTAGTQDEQAALQFGPPLTEPLFSMRCGDAGALLLQRHGLISGPGLTAMMVEIGGTVARLAANPVEGSLPALRATLPADSPLVAQMGRGRITVRAGDGEPLLMPASPLLGEFAQGCREGGQGPAVAEADPANVAETNATAPADSSAATPSERTPR